MSFIKFNRTTRLFEILANTPIAINGCIEFDIRLKVKEESRSFKFTLCLDGDNNKLNVLPEEYISEIKRFTQYYQRDEL
jgi:hypothetical protein